MERVVITNFDTVSSSGIGKEEFSKNILTKNDYSSLITLFDTAKYNTKSGFELKDFDFTAFLGKSGLKHMNRTAKIAMCSIEKKLLPEFADLGEEEKPPLIIGTALGSVESIADFWKTYLIEGFAYLRPLDFPNTVINAPGSFINIRYGITEASVTISNGYNSSLDAFIYAYDYIQNGYANFLIVGGAEELSEYSFAGQIKSKVLSESNKMLPFSKNANGYLVGEGSAFFIVESLENAKKRNANIICELIGFSNTFSYDSKPKEAIKAYNEALNMANISPREINLVSSCANGVKAIDDLCLIVYKEVFKDDLKNTNITAHKSYFGECYGASGALQVAASIANMEEKKISAIFSTDLIENLDSFSTNVVNKDIKYFAVDSFGCDGNNTVLIFKKY
ncbi:MAG: hypothetical protein A2086_06345 [Spirochaetes bacterium GWD1_27_9]|nr:MAG: hypothetical protein A2Z98_17010 [Spirochaetes bacterium GWB1_27_13]OHD25956.1 MAG: hypothetical protein A2Y34_14450 [Spirochaetes bacterium GWC1_27_15]OHD43509.1 MAG: hypothetical protein A2086_06345 [Spirochaetes bacterium GWD1_27_9]